MFRERHKRVRKNTKVVAAEAAEVAAEAQEIARLEETTDKPWLIAAPRHGLRRGRRDGLRHSHARVHGQSISIFFNKKIKHMAFYGDVMTSQGSKYYF